MRVMGFREIWEKKGERVGEEERRERGEKGREEVVSSTRKKEGSETVLFHAFSCYQNHRSSASP